MGSRELEGLIEGASLYKDGCLMLGGDPRPRLRWSPELHGRFVDAITQLGGPNKATPKTLMRAMGVEGLTLYHLKSHLQKYRMGRQSCKELPDNPTDASGAVESQATGSTSSSSSRRITNNLNDGCNGAMRIQMELQRRPQEHLEVQVQQRLEIRITAQEKYLHSILERACSVLIQPDLTAMEMFVSVRHDLPQFPAWGAEGYEHRSEVITPPFLEGKSANRVVPPHRVKAEDG